MAEQAYMGAALIVVGGSYLRVVAATLAAVRTLASRGRFRTFQMGPVEMLVAPEPLVLAAVTSLMLAVEFQPSDASVLNAAAAAIGAALVLYAWNLTAWSFLSWRTVFFGHGVQEGQTLVTGGAYGLVRHPIYLGVLLIWLGLSLAFLSLIAFVITAVYVGPSYLLYVRSEERMMNEQFGDAYARYCQRVPMLLPYVRLIPQLRPGD